MNQTYKLEFIKKSVYPTFNTTFDLRFVTYNNKTVEFNNKSIGVFCDQMFAFN